MIHLLPTFVVSVCHMLYFVLTLIISGALSTQLPEQAPSASPLVPPPCRSATPALEEVSVPRRRATRHLRLES